MENKYQEAYEKLADTLHWGELPKDLELCDEMKVIKELIDNYSKLSQFDRAVFFNANGVCVEGITYEQLEKALELACEYMILFAPFEMKGHNRLYYLWKKDKNTLKEHLLKVAKEELENDK